MARVRLLHGVHRKGANGVDAQLIELCTGGGDRLVTDCHQSSPRKGFERPTPNLDEDSAKRDTPNTDG
jgi:hypothetical protein